MTLIVVFRIFANEPTNNFPGRFSKNPQISIFVKIRPVGTPVVPCGRTDMMKQKVFFRIFFLNEPTNNFPDWFSKNPQISIFMKLRPVGTPVVPCGPTNIMKLIVVFRIFANESTNILFVDCTVQFTKASQIKTLNMLLYLVFYRTQKAHNYFIFLCIIALPPVSHSSNHQSHCWNLQNNPAMVRNFIEILRFSVDSPPYLNSKSDLAFHEIWNYYRNDTRPKPLQVTRRRWWWWWWLWWLWWRVKN